MSDLQEEDLIRQELFFSFLCFFSSLFSSSKPGPTSLPSGVCPLCQHSLMLSEGRSRPLHLGSRGDCGEEDRSNLRAVSGGLASSRRGTEGRTPRHDVETSQPSDSTS